MAAVIIRKKDVERLGKELLKEIFDFFHDEYILNYYIEMKIEQKKFLENLASNHIDTLHRQFKITEEKREELVNLMKIDSSEFVKDAMKDDGIDIEGIYQTLINLELYSEINEDLYYKTKTFLDILRVFESGYTYLED